jgi:hypothetical protein
MKRKREKRSEKGKLNEGAKKKRAKNRRGVKSARFPPSGAYTGA